MALKVLITWDPTISVFFILPFALHKTFTGLQRWHSDNVPYLDQIKLFFLNYIYCLIDHWSFTSSLYLLMQNVFGVHNSC